MGEPWRKRFCAILCCIKSQLVIASRVSLQFFSWGFALSAEPSKPPVRRGLLAWGPKVGKAISAFLYFLAALAASITVWEFSRGDKKKSIPLIAKALERFGESSLSFRELVVTEPHRSMFLAYLFSREGGATDAQNLENLMYLAKTLPDRQARAWALAVLADWHIVHRDWEQATYCLEEALALHSEKLFNAMLGHIAQQRAQERRVNKGLGTFGK